MTVVETLLVLAVIPAAIFGLITLLTLRPKLNRPRIQGDQDWEFAPVFWVANPSSVTDEALDGDSENSAVQEAQLSTARGGARGNW